MLEGFFARDRFIMAGLVLLGLATVSAGVLSGRMVLKQALETNAVRSAYDLTRKLETRRHREAAGERTANPGHVAGAEARDPADGRPVKHADDAAADEQISRIVDFAMLDLQKALVLKSNKFSHQALGRILRRPEFGPIFDEAVVTRRARLLAGEGPSFSIDEGLYVVVPAIEADRVGHVYVVRLDHSAAVQMTEAALTRASVVTILLMVIGFAVPAVVASRRIRERLAAEDQLRYLALHDPITGLANRPQLHDRLNHAVARAKRHGSLMAVFYLDLDRFKDVNDSLGHPVGDALLEEVAVRLKKTVREVDVVARLGGDEFAVVAEDFDEPEYVDRLARRLCSTLAEPYSINGHNVMTSASIGIAFAPIDALDADELLRNADVALYRAKQDGRNTFCFFEPEMETARQDRCQLEQELRMALRDEKLRLHYQPQFDLETGCVTGYEALLRWRHPVRGELSPAIFIPVAEQAGLIAELGEWVLRTACAYAAGWPDNIILAVNLSPAQLKGQDISALVARVLDEVGFPAHRLELEIAEGVLLANTEAVVAQLKQLDALGVSIAMDDFGTGYSSLNYLTRLPVKKIKIDRSFIDTLGTNAQTDAIVSTIVGLGHSLNVRITAEGVETESQLQYLKACGCDEVQGFLCGRPKAEVIQKPFVVVNNESQRSAAISGPGS